MKHPYKYPVSGFYTAWIAAYDNEKLVTEKHQKLYIKKGAPVIHHVSKGDAGCNYPQMYRNDTLYVAAIYDDLSSIPFTIMAYDTNGSIVRSVFDVEQGQDPILSPFSPCASSMPFYQLRWPPCGYTPPADAYKAALFVMDNDSFWTGDTFWLHYDSRSARPVILSPDSGTALQDSFMVTWTEGDTDYVNGRNLLINISYNIIDSAGHIVGPSVSVFQDSLSRFEYIIASGKKVYSAKVSIPSNESLYFKLFVGVSDWLSGSGDARNYYWKKE